MVEHDPEQPETRLLRCLANERAARDFADAMSDPELRQTWVDIADNWRFLAERIRRHYQL